MDFNGPSDSAERSAEPASERHVAAQLLRSPLIRIGYLSLAASVIVTFIGTVLLAQGRTTYESMASMIRHLGLCLMLISCAVVLVGYRMPQLRRWYKMIHDPTMEDPSIRPSAVSGSPNTVRQQSQFSLQTLFALMTISAVVLGVVFSAPNTIFAFCAAYAQLMLVSMLIVVIVYDRGLPQTFCIAALTPAVLSVFMASFIGAWVRMSGQFSFRLIFIINWVMIILIGLAGVGVRTWLATNTRNAVTTGSRDAGRRGTRADD